MMSSQVEIAVIGGGITGLAAAWELERLSSVVRVTLVEASTRLGGWVRTERWGEVLIEHGPDSWVASKPSATTLACALGLAHDLIGLRSDHAGVGIVRHGQIVPLPEGLSLLVPTRLGSLLSSPLLSPWGKLRVLAEFLVPPRHDEADESLATFVRRRFGREFSERVAEPLVAGIYAGDPEQLSLLATYPQFRELELRAGSLLRALVGGARRHALAGKSLPGELFSTEHGSEDFSRRQAPVQGSHRRDALTAQESACEEQPVASLPRSPFLTLRRGMEQLVLAIAASLRRTNVRLGATATGIRARETGFTIEFINGTELEVDGIVLAIPAWNAVELLKKLDPAAAELLRSIPYRSSAAVTLVYERAALETVARNRGFLVPAREGRPVSAVTWVTNKFPGRAPEHLALARVFFRGNHGWPMEDVVPEVLVAVALRELRALSGVRAEPLHAVVSDYERALPQYLVGHRARVMSLRERLAHWPALALAGAAYDGVGVPDCIASGQRAARAVAAALGLCRTQCPPP